MSVYRDPLGGLRGQVEQKRAAVSDLLRRWTPMRERLMSLEHHNAFVLAGLAMKTDHASLGLDALAEAYRQLDELEVVLRDAVHVTDALLAFPPVLPRLVKRDVEAPPSAWAIAARDVYAERVGDIERWGDDGWSARFDAGGVEHELAIEASRAGRVTCRLCATMPLAMPPLRIVPVGEGAARFEDAFVTKGDEPTAGALLQAGEARAILLDLAARGARPGLAVEEGRVQLAWSHEAGAAVRELLDAAVQLVALLRAEAVR